MRQESETCKNQNLKEKPLKGRSAWLIKYREDHPALTDEVDDDSLWSYAHDGYSDLEGKYNRLTGANQRLAELVNEDPRLGVALSMVAGEDRKSLPYAFGTVYGRDFLENDLEEFEAGYQENLKRLAESRREQQEAQKNIGESMANIEKFGRDNGLDEKQLSELNGGIMDFAENLLMGKIPETLIDLVYKGLNYDKDVRDAAVTGEIEGRNQKIDPMFRRSAGIPIPDLSAGTGGGESRNGAFRKRGSFYDGLTEEKN